MTIYSTAVAPSQTLPGARLKAVSGNINSDPTRKQIPPRRVKTTETVAASISGALGGTKAKTAEIMKATHPIKLMKVTHHDKLRGFHAQCA